MKDSPCFESVDVNSTKPVQLLCSVLYQRHKERLFLLDQNVRQQQESIFVFTLKRIPYGTPGRDPSFTDTDLSFWNDRRLRFLSPEEKQLFDLRNNQTVDATGFNKDRDNINR